MPRRGHHVPEMGGSSWAQEWRRQADRNCTPVSPFPDGVVLVDRTTWDRKGTGPEAKGLRKGVRKVVLALRWAPRRQVGS